MLSRIATALTFFLRAQTFWTAGTVAAVGLLAAVAFSSPTHAFTLAELDAGGSFEAGGLRFDNFEFDSAGSRNVDPLLINITPVDSPPLAGFEVSDGMNGDLTLQFEYTVTAVGTDGISAALIWLTDYDTLGVDWNIAGSLSEDGEAFRDLGFFVDPLSSFLADTDGITPVPAIHLELRSDLRQDLSEGGGSAVTTGAYTNLFRVVPEPGAAALGLAALSMVAVLARTRRSRS